ncbi:MAG: phosphatase PAP2 family protein [Coprobacillus sp.]
MNVFNKRNCIIIFSVLFFLMIIGSCFDYQISSYLYNENSVIGVALASYGQVPAMLCSSIGGTLLLRITSTNSKIKIVLSYLFCLILNLFAIMGITMDPMLYIPGISFYLSVTIAVILVIGVDIIIWKLTKETDKKILKRFIIVILAVMFIEIIFINIVKVPWARPRMRMLAHQELATFQPWWIIGSEMKDHLLSLGVAAEEFKSFPSGHSGNAACAMLLGVLPILSVKLKGKENILFLSGIIFTMIVAFSRIIMGAHFLTDITIGITITFVIEVIVINFLLVKKSNE